MKIAIEFDIIKRIAKATPELTLAQFAAVWTEKLNEEKRERDRERKVPGKQPETPGIEQEQRGTTYEEQQKELFVLARQICGRNAGGMVTILLKRHNFQNEAVRDVLERARKTADPAAFVAGICRKVKNGTGPSLMDSFDSVIDRTAGEAFGAGDQIRDITPRSSDAG